jgi:hypothetical protein
VYKVIFPIIPFAETFKSSYWRHNIREIFCYKKPLKRAAPSLLWRFLDLGSEIQDPGYGMGKKSESGINIPDPQHWYWQIIIF